MKNEEVKQKILDSIKYAQDNMSLTLISEDWGNKVQLCACAMGCVILKENPAAFIKNDKLTYLRVADLLGVTEDWVDSFVDGFDLTGLVHEAKVPEAWEIGFDIAQELKPIPYSQFANRFIVNKETSP